MIGVLQMIEKETMQKVLAEVGGNRKKVMQISGISFTEYKSNANFAD